VRARGLDVTVVDPLTVPLERVLGVEVGAIYRDIHAAQGVRMLSGTRVTAFEGAGAVERVRTADGRTLDCDFVVVGVGVRPRTALAAEGGVYVDDGVLVDEYLQTSRPGVFAAGDVAMTRYPYLARRFRVEHWANALHQGQVAARNMLARSEVYDRVPYFYSDQYDARHHLTGREPRRRSSLRRGIRSDAPQAITAPNDH